MKKIFCQLVSYKDSNIIENLKYLIDTSSNPERLVVSLVWQTESSDIQEFTNKGFEYLNSTNINTFFVFILKYKNAICKVIDVNYIKSAGYGWSRNLAQKLYKNEEFTLIIDSKTQLVKNWDKKIIKIWNKLNIPNAIITTYLNSDKNNKAKTKQSFSHITKDGIISFKEEKVFNNKNSPFETEFLSKHFLFSTGNFSKEVKFDPKLFEDVIEITLSIRAYTCGYTFYNPNQFLGWFDYCKDSNYKEDRINLLKNQIIHKDWNEREKDSINKYKRLLGIDQSKRQRVKYFGLGTKRSFDDYEKFSNISFKDKKFLVENEINLNKSKHIESKSITIEVDKFYQKEFVVTLFDKNDNELFTQKFKNTSQADLYYLENFKPYRYCLYSIKNNVIQHQKEVLIN